MHHTTHRTTTPHHITLHIPPYHTAHTMHHTPHTTPHTTHYIPHITPHRSITPPQTTLPHTSTPHHMKKYRIMQAVLCASPPSPAPPPPQTYESSPPVFRTGMGCHACTGVVQHLWHAGAAGRWPLHQRAHSERYEERLEREGQSSIHPHPQPLLPPASLPSPHQPLLPIPPAFSYLHLPPMTTYTSVHSSTYGHTLQADHPPPYTCLLSYFVLEHLTCTYPS